MKPSDEGVGSGMARATFDGVVIAESDDVKVVEGMTYFPVESVDMGQLVQSPTTSRCFWKGKASYWHVQGNDDIAQNAAFTYERPWPLAKRLVTDRVAFWQGVEVSR
jgi:uncharacterized protein (DUF427 family)